MLVREYLYCVGDAMFLDCIFVAFSFFLTGCGDIFMRM